MNRQIERLIIDGYWIVAFVLMLYGVVTKSLWFAGGGMVMMFYLAFTDKYTVKDLVARDDMMRSIGDLEQVIEDIEKEG
jgi:hypothetical protein